MALGCGRTGGSIELIRNQCVDGSAMGNSPATTHGRGAGEDLGEKALTGGPRLSASVEQ
jgi:hypothetical protein